jgi:hypothetical protein
MYDMKACFLGSSGGLDGHSTFAAFALGGNDCLVWESECVGGTWAYLSLSRFHIIRFTVAIDEDHQFR